MKRLIDDMNAEAVANSQTVTAATIGELNPVAIFKAGGISPIIEAIRAEVSSEVPDTSTAKGRAEIASLAHKVAKSKTTLDAMGKALADDLNAQLKPINAERKIARDQLDLLKLEIRAPLTDWEWHELKAKEEFYAKKDAEKLAETVAADYEVAILMHEIYERDIAEQVANRAAIQAAEDERILKEQAERDERIRQEAKSQEERRALAERAEEKRVQLEREANREHVSLIRKGTKEALMTIGGVNEDLARLIVMAISQGLIANVTIKY